MLLYVISHFNYIRRCLIFFQCMGEYRRENAKHLFAELMGEGACQLDILDIASWGCKLTSETIPISIGGL